MNILLLHPGAMGASVGAALTKTGHDVAWIPEGRSEATRKRADAAGLKGVATLADGIDHADIVISVCPPHAAVEQAHTVADAGFTGTYVDANAVAPATAETVAALFAGRYVDGGIIGPPAWRPGATRLYLSGPEAPAIAELFAGSLLDARAIAGSLSPADGSLISASALKMCYAAFTKGSSALLLAVRALADAQGVTAPLLEEWDISQPNLAARSEATAAGTSPKAWRFEGEMREIAATFKDADLPDGFHQAAAAIYARMAGLKDVPDADMEAVLQVLNQK